VKERKNRKENKTKQNKRKKSKKKLKKKEKKRLYRKRRLCPLFAPSQPVVTFSVAARMQSWNFYLLLFALFSI